MAARYGGEEFILVLSDTDPSGAFHMAEEARKGMEALHIPHAEGLESPCVTISAGIWTVVPSKASNPEDMIRFADEALYEAKRLGRNRSVVYGQAAEGDNPKDPKPTSHPLKKTDIE